MGLVRPFDRDKQGSSNFVFLENEKHDFRNSRHGLAVAISISLPLGIWRLGQNIEY
jgi:hypothetical protein